MKYKLGIDASRNRSGGAKAHIIGILKDIECLPEEMEEVHIWSYDELLNMLPNYPWLIKHSPKSLKRSLIHQLMWQYKCLPKEAKEAKIDIMLNTDAGTISRFLPAITMSRDMLSYEPGEMQRFGLSFQRLRLLALKYVQNYSLKNSTAAIFLTKYAAEVIQKSSGNIANYKVIPHGVSENFRINTSLWKNDERIAKPIRCIYVSNVALYKHQWNVVKAIANLRNEGYNLIIDFVGGGEGKAQDLFLETVAKVDPKREFVSQYEFVSHKDLPIYLANSDIFIFASSCENMPNTLIEGMCTGIPIICSSRGPMPEVLQNGGLYFDPENSMTITNTLKKMIDNELERMEFAKKSKDLSKQYSWNRCGKETFNYVTEVYNNLKK
ncbi:Glycosyltransferase involved in cell wall bisynthesis [Paenimyroides ummariense]|uniref:Glycosyltransferase involved in cell wall bisynthesis n=1 Tax=Paenimyroides ummariense TaxID=913024 RepID=A0A1I5DU66_9FLAO|nr:glycosyltransferase [Paenimyroides ummariense]SFO02726.1 Glycosyltransferase involved in cell wall bisynthesis [Paenimyroides ummariense]